MIVTRVAALGFPDHRFRGYSVFGELVGHENVAGLIALAISGRRLSADDTSLLDELAAATAVGDPRIWPLKLIRVVASYGGILAGYAAGHMVLEGDRIGPPITLHAAEMLAGLRAEIGDAIDDAVAIEQHARELVARRKRLIGYGIPFRPYDERYVTIRDRLIARGRHVLPHFRVQEVLSAVVLEQRKLVPNIGIATAAMLLDMGFNPSESAALIHFLNQPVFIANAYESGVQASPDLRSLPASAIAYSGSAPRLSPRARSSSADDDDAGGVLHRR